MAKSATTDGRVTLPALFWAALSGALLTGAFPDIDLVPLAFVALVPLLMVVRHRRLKAAFALGWAAGLVHHLTLLYWTAYTMHVYGLLPWTLCIPVLVLLGAYLSLYTGVFAMLAARLGDRPGWLMAGAPCAWTALEYIRAHALTGFPWAQMGTSLSGWTTIIQAADVTGVYGITFMLVLVNTAISMLWRAFLEKPATAATVTRRQATVALMVAAAVTGAFLAYGAWRLDAVAERIGAAPSVRAAVIQGNIEQAVKWDRRFLDTTIATYVNLSLQAATERPDLIVWPETAMPYYYGRQTELDAVVASGIRRTGANFLIGTPTFTRDAGRLAYYNTAILVDPAARTIGSYSKSHLVPFGEYVPLKRWLPFIGKMVAQVGDFAAGRPGETLPWAKGRIGTQICYEVIFPELSRQMVRNGADLLVNITNDAWFGRTGAPYQHFAMAVFRAVENRRSLVRAANTGISGFIDPTGRPLAMTPLFEPTTASAVVPRLTMTTIYTRFGDVFALLCLAVAAAMAWRSARWRD